VIIAAEVYINSSTEQSEVVIYTSVDQIYSEPVLEKFEEEIGIKAESEAYDLTESGLFCAKTLMNVHNKVNIMSVGFNESRSPARKGIAFIRSDPVLWIIAVESGSAVFSSMDLDTAAEMYPCAPSTASPSRGLSSTSGGTVTAARSTWKLNFL
jgi:hypothetical protein